LQQQDRGCLDFFGGGVIFAWFETPTTRSLFHRNVFDFLFSSFSFPRSHFFIIYLYSSMRTLKVASLVGLAPLLLILPTFLAFLLLAHCQAWCQPLYEISPTLSTWNSTATTLLPIQVTTPPPSYTMDNTTTISSSFRPSSLLQTWLKRWRHSKRKSPALWILCGGTFLFCSMYLHKVTKQTTMTNQTQLTGRFFFLSLHPGTPFSCYQSRFPLCGQDMGGIIEITLHHYYRQKAQYHLLQNSAVKKSKEA
jgi:hypothetical protein